MYRMLQRIPRCLIKNKKPLNNFNLPNRLCSTANTKGHTNDHTTHFGFETVRESEKEGKGTPMFTFIIIFFSHLYLSFNIIFNFQL